MNWFEETVRALSAALKLLLHDRDGLSDLNNTTTGFWHSFSAIILIAPLYLFMSSINWAPDSTTVASNSAAFHLITLALQWALWPLVMVFVTRKFGLGKFFSRYVIVYNWSNVLIITMLAIPALLFKIGLLPLEGAGLFTGLLQLGTFYLEWYLARLSLETTGFIAGAIVLGNFVLSVGLLRIIG